MVLRDDATYVLYARHHVTEQQRQAREHRTAAASQLHQGKAQAWVIDASLRKK
jgi:hypothetical protein